MKKLLVLLCCILLIHIGFEVEAQSKFSNQTILKINNEEILASDFLYLYAKNYEQEEGAYTIKSLEEYYELFLNFKMKVFEAKQQKLHRKDAFIKEFKTYRDQLAAPYLTDSEVTEEIIQEAYERLQYEVKAAHILIRIPANATAEDTLAAYKKIEDLRLKAANGEDFNQLAAQFSEDPSAKQNQGNLGYFTALQMVYPFENAAFNTTAGSVSTPVRTRFGYHILKVEDKRPASGEITAAHILVRSNQAQDSAAYQKITEIHKQLLQGEDWDKLCKQFSEDQGSKAKGGLLRPFTSGMMVAPFSEAAFQLKNPGDFSAPFKTPYGWHIVKLINKKLPGTFEEMRPEIERKIKKDTRNNVPQQVFIEQLKKDLKFNLSNEAKNNVFAQVDERILAAKFDLPKDETLLNTTIFSLNDTFKVNAGQFYNYIKTNQRLQKNITPQQYLELMFNAFTNEQIIAYEDAHLSKKYPEFGYVEKEYYEGLLLFEIMENEVWNKAVEDSVGLKAYFNNNRDNYKWGNRIKTVMLDASDKAILKKAARKYETGIFPSTIKEEVLPMEMNSLQWGDSILNKIDNILSMLIKDTALYVNIECGYVKGEDKSLAELRAQKLSAYIYAKKLDSAKVLSIKTSKQKVSDTTLKGGQMRFSFQSKNPEQITAQFNKEDALALQVKRQEFEQEVDELPKGVDWQIGVYDYSEGNRFYRMYVNSVEPGAQKALGDTRGQVISDYQNHLEKQWLDTLKSKYKVETYPELLKKINAEKN